MDSAKQEASQWFNTINYKIAQVNSTFDKNRYTMELDDYVIVTSTSTSASIIDYAVHNMVSLRPTTISENVSIGTKIIILNLNVNFLMIR